MNAIYCSHLKQTEEKNKQQKELYKFAWVIWHFPPHLHPLHLKTESFLCNAAERKKIMKLFIFPMRTLPYACVCVFFLTFIFYWNKKNWVIFFHIIYHYTWLKLSDTAMHLFSKYTKCVYERRKTPHRKRNT